MKEFLSELGIKYIVRDVRSDPEAVEEFMRLGAPLPPVTVYQGRWVAGYDPDALDRLLRDIV